MKIWVRPDHLMLWPQPQIGRYVHYWSWSEPKLKASKGVQSELSSIMTGTLPMIILSIIVWSVYFLCKRYVYKLISIIQTNGSGGKRMWPRMLIVLRIYFCTSCRTGRYPTIFHMKEPDAMVSGKIISSILSAAISNYRSHDLPSPRTKIWSLAITTTSLDYQESQTPTLHPNDITT